MVFWIVVFLLSCCGIKERFCTAHDSPCLFFLTVTLWMLLICNSCMVSFFMFVVDVSFWGGSDKEL